MNPKDLLIICWPEPIPGGLSVGMSRGVKITHLPSGLVTICDSERSQHMNRDKALADLDYKLSQLQPAAKAAYMMCAYCNSVEGGHTLACQAIHSGRSPPKQVPIPEDSPWLQRRRAEAAAKSGREQDVRA